MSKPLPPLPPSNTFGGMICFENAASTKAGDETVMVPAGEQGHNFQEPGTWQGIGKGLHPFPRKATTTITASATVHRQSTRIAIRRPRILKVVFFEAGVAEG